MLPCLSLVVALAAGAAEVEAYLDAQTIGVVRIDVTRLDVNAVVKRAMGLGIAEDDTAGPRLFVNEVIAKLRGAGVTTVYGVVSGADLPASPVFVVVPLPAGADADKAGAVLKLLPGFQMVKGDGVVLAAPPPVLARLKTARPAARPDLAAALTVGRESGMVVAVAPPADTRKVIEEAIPRLPGAAGNGPVTVLTRGLSWAALTFDTTPKVAAGLTVQAADPVAAKEIDGILKSVVKAAAAGPADASEIKAIGVSLAPLVTTAIDGERVILRLDADRIDATLPGAAAAVRAAANARSLRNMKDIAIAIHNYYSAYDRFPADITDKAGKPILSWRVAVLPYMHAGDLYKQLRLDEPWDSEHNKKLVDKIPAQFVSPHQKSPRGTTTYLAPSGDGYFLTPGVKNRKFNDLPDGSSNTLMLVEVADELAAPWTKPGDWQPDKTDLLKGLLGHLPDRFNAGFVDGYARAIRKSIDPKDLKALLTIAGNEVAGPIP